MFGTLLKRKPAPSTAPSSNASSPLSDRHLILLSRAAARDDRRVVLPDGQDNDGINAALELLAGRGFVERNGEGEDASFRISAAGLAHIGLPDDEAPAPNASASAAEQVETPAATPEIRPLAEGQKPVAASGSANAKRVETARRGFKRISPGSPPAPSRKTALIALLQRPEGVSLQQIGEAFGWLPHSARAALSGLRKAGHGIERRAGSEGTEAIYRIAEPAAMDHCFSGGVHVQSDPAATGAGMG